MGSFIARDLIQHGGHDRDGRTKFSAQSCQGATQSDSFLCQSRKRREGQRWGLAFPKGSLFKGQTVVLTHECCFRDQVRSFVSNKTQPNTQSKRGGKKIINHLS